MRKTKNISDIGPLNRGSHDFRVALLSGAALLSLAVAACGSSASSAGPSDHLDGGGAQCLSPKTWRYETPGCGAEASPICGSTVEDGCLAIVCGCDGEILTGCDYFEKPWRARGLCPGTCYSPTANLQFAAMYPLQVPGCACDVATDRSPCVPIAGGYAPITCSQGAWQLGDWYPDAAACAGGPAPDASVEDLPAADAGPSNAPGDGAVDAGPPVADGAAVDAAASTVPRIIDPQVPDADIESLSADNAAFAFSAYQKLSASAGNLVFSPASISIALAMTYAGAAGDTATEMAQALHFNLPPARLHPAINALDQALAARGAGQLGTDGGPMRLEIVNALWAEQSYTFRSDFLGLLAANYGAGVNLLDFVRSAEGSRQIINGWVAQMTDDKIQELLPQGSIDAQTKLVLSNAVYLNARWKTALENDGDGTFTLLDNSRITIHEIGAEAIQVPAVRGSGFDAVSLPYADDRLSLVLVVPEAGQLAELESTMDASMLAGIVSSMTSKRIGLSMPAFNIATTTALADVLMALGMKAAFSPDQADFSGMTGGRDLYIGGAFHKAYIAVSEKGTEAAAATAVVMKDAGFPMVDLEITIDHPFLYYLRDAPTGAILFMGRVLDPSQS